MLATASIAAAARLGLLVGNCTSVQCCRCSCGRVFDTLCVVGTSTCATGVSGRRGRSVASECRPPLCVYFVLKRPVLSIQNYLGPWHLPQLPLGSSAPVGSRFEGPPDHLALTCLAFFKAAQEMQRTKERTAMFTISLPCIPWIVS